MMIKRRRKQTFPVDPPERLAVGDGIAGAGANTDAAMILVKVDTEKGWV